LRGRDAIVTGLIALAVGAVMSLPAVAWFEGVSLDALTWLRHSAFGPRHSARQSPTVIIAVDEETHRTEGFADVPNALWTREMALVLSAVLDGGAKVVGFDIIYPTAIERFVPGFDRDFLLALRRGAQDGRVVLGKVQHSEQPIRPFPGQSFAVGHTQNIRSINLFRDEDEVIRRVPIVFEAEGGGKETAMSVELARRALGVDLAAEPDGGVRLGEYRIPGSHRNAMPLDFAGGGEAIPSFSFADLHRCATQGKAEFFRENFAGKIVLVGAVLDVEDRKMTSARYVTAIERGATGPRCASTPRIGLYSETLLRDTIPGVFVHATAVNNLLRGQVPHELGAVSYWLVSTALIAGAAFAAAMTTPILAAGLVLLGALAWVAVATVAFHMSTVLPLIDPVLGAGMALAIMLGYRFMVADRDKRFLRRSFALYLEPAVIERLVAAEALPALGGERREMTVLFSDIAGFSTLAEGMAPAALTKLLNEYLTAMGDEITTHHGTIDKFIGDAIVAMFGAPAVDPAHATNAVMAALACQGQLAALNAGGGIQGHRLEMRIGLNTGPMLVGNMGSRARFNYTVIGDNANLGARLEGANKLYGTSILASETTKLAAPAIGWREIDTVRVAGRATPVTIFAPLDDELPVDIKEAYAAGLVAYRHGQFAAALAQFERIAAQDRPAGAMAARARRLLAAPPARWDGVTELESK
jgi:adenylate cyclase